MSRYRKILVAFDGSPSSENALTQAFSLAHYEKSWLTVVTVVPSYDGDMDLTGVSDIHGLLRRPGEDILSRAAAYAKKEGILIKPVLEEGIPHERIVKLSEEGNHSTLIVMGRRGMSRIEKAFMGSTTARVIGHSTNDVLVLPDGSSIGWQKILVAIDGSRQSLRAADRAIDLARCHKSSLTFLSAVDFPAEFYGEAPDVVDTMIEEAKKHTAKIVEKASAAGLPVSAMILEDEAHNAIIKTAQQKQVQTIVLGSHGRTGIKRLLMGSVAEKVIGFAPCPVLIVKSR